MADDLDLYRVLGVAPGADTDEIRRAHRTLVRALHPDRHVEATQAEQKLAERRMREINEAWHTLRDPVRRANYDFTRKKPNPSGASRSASAAQQRPASPRAGGTRPRGTGARPGTSAPGRGAYWKQPGGTPKQTFAPERGARTAEEHGQAVSPGTLFLLRRGPVIAGIVVLVGLFVATAFISGGGGDTTDVIPEPLGACVVLEEQSSGYLVDCALPNDGEVVARVEAALDCPLTTRYVQVGTEFFCIPIPLGG
ncbi:MAG: J domain-containing protein [Actinomycetia bacterium]|nr:J domain-containing protein [Actinomycetes bacterium]